MFHCDFSSPLDLICGEWNRSQLFPVGVARESPPSQSSRRNFSTLIHSAPSYSAVRQVGIANFWEAVLDGAVNKRNLSTGETGEFASESLGSGLIPGG
jgi:hypothetical protein